MERQRDVEIRETQRNRERDIEKQRETWRDRETQRSERDMERQRDVEIREREISHVALGESPCDADLKTVNFCFN